MGKSLPETIEGGFSFKGLYTDSYTFDTELPKDVIYWDVLEKAIKVEEKIQKDYLDSAEMSKSLLADIPKVFERIAQKRGNRKIQLEPIYYKSRTN